MIEEVKMYTVVCDNCGEDIGEDSEYSCWNVESAARDNAIDSGWAVEDDEKNEEKHYCPKCFQGHDDYDNIIIDKTRTKAVVPK